MQTFTYDIIARVFDGVSEVDLEAPELFGPDQVVEVEQSAAGLVSLNLDAADFSANSGSRIVSQLYVFSPTPGGAGARVAVVDGRVPFRGELQTLVADLDGVDKFFRLRPFVVPQGSLLQIRGFDASPQSVLVRVQVIADPSPEELFKVSCDCAGDGDGDGDGDGILEIANIGGAPGEVWAQTVAQIAELRTLVGVNGATVTTVGDVVQIDGGGGASPVLSASFADNTTLDLPVGTVATDGLIVVDMSLFNTVTNQSQSVRWQFAVSPTDVDIDALQVDSSAASPLTAVLDLSSFISGPSVIARLAGSGPGDNIEVRYTIRSIPRL